MSQMSEHEKNYSVSQWNKRCSPEEVVLQFCKLAAIATKRARKSTACQLDVAYGSSPREKYDIYGTDLPKDAPIFVFIHGGYWQELSKDFTGFGIENLVAKGVKVINIGYDLCPDVKLSDIVSQIKCAMQKILKSARDSGCRGVWVSGHSAGALLTASLVFDEKFISNMVQENCYQLLKGLLLIGGIYNLRPLIYTSYNDALNLTDDEIKTLSYATLDVTDNEAVRGVKVIVAVGECDSPTFIEESRQISRKLISVVDNLEYILLRDNIDHYNILENLVDPDYILTRKILQQIASN